MDIIVYIILPFLVVAGLLTGFIIVQIKASAVWRLLSIAVLVLVSCAISARISRYDAFADIGENYARRMYLYNNALDSLALQGRTMDIHQACVRFGNTPLYSLREEDISNFNDLATSTFNISESSATTGITNNLVPRLR